MSRVSGHSLPGSSQAGASKEPWDNLWGHNPDWTHDASAVTHSRLHFKGTKVLPIPHTNWDPFHINLWFFRDQGWENSDGTEINLNLSTQTFQKGPTPKVAFLELLVLFMTSCF